MAIDVVSGGRMLLPTDSSLNLTEGSNATWFSWGRPDVTGGIRCMIEQRNSGGRENFNRFNGDIWQGGAWGSDQFYAHSTSVAERAKMTLYIATNDGSLWRSYIDGELVGSSTGTNGARDVVGIAWAIGAEDGGGRFWDGEIADARVYDRVLTPAEIQTAYAVRGRDRIKRGLIWRYRLQGSGTMTNRNSTGPIAASATPTGTISWTEDKLGHRRRPR